MMEFITNSVYGHGAILLACLLLVSIITKFDEVSVFTYGLYLFVLWSLIELFFVLRADHYWMSALYLTLTSLVVYAVFLGLAFICEKFGTKARGDGAGWGLLAPLFVYFYLFIVSLLIKGVILIWNYFV